MSIKCVKCKGDNPLVNCGRTFCPIIAKAHSAMRVKAKLTEKDFSGVSPAPFVGRFGYPNISVGILSPACHVDNAWEYDSPHHWAEQDYLIEKIIDFRSELVNSMFKANVKGRNRLLDISREVGIASKPVDVEISLEKKPAFRMNTGQFLAPTGPHGKLKKAEITSNPKISSKVERVTCDYDFKANDAVIYLYNKGFDQNFLSKALSVGNFGVRKDRKLVPTRWSITAADDAIGKHIIDEIKQYNEHDFAVYSGSYLGNYYYAAMFPSVWGFELFETYLPGAGFNISDEVQYTSDHEFYGGRKTYAENCGGGYYAARLPVLEKLRKEKRQASVVVFRFITGEYAAPLGVWVCREAAAKAVKSKPVWFDDKGLMLDYLREKVRNKFGYDLRQLIDRSVLLKEMRSQTKLADFVQ